MDSIRHFVIAALIRLANLISDQGSVILTHPLSFQEQQKRSRRISDFQQACEMAWKQYLDEEGPDAYNNWQSGDTMVLEVPIEVPSTETLEFNPPFRLIERKRHQVRPQPRIEIRDDEGQNE
jgi:hypothetical protein